MFKMMNKMPPDKMLHFFWGAVAALFGWLIWSVWNYFLTDFLLPFWPFVLVHGLGAWAKEVVHDWWMGKGQFDVMDAVFTQAPMLQIWAVIEVVA